MSTEYSIDNTMTQETFNAFQNGYKQAKQEDSKKFILIIFLILFFSGILIFYQIENNKRLIELQKEIEVRRRIHNKFTDSTIKYLHEYMIAHENNVKKIIDKLGNNKYNIFVSPDEIIFT